MERYNYENIRHQIAIMCPPVGWLHDQNIAEEFIWSVVVVAVERRITEPHPRKLYRPKIKWCQNTTWAALYPEQ